MKSLSSTLLAAQKKRRAKPYLELLVRDQLGANTRLTWSQVYTAEDDDEPHAMCIAGDDSIVRVKATGAGWTRYQRVTDVSDPEQWDDWGAGGTLQCSEQGQMYLVAQASGSYVWWFYIGRNENNLYCRESSDYGASWGSPVTVYTVGGSDKLESVCAAVISGTDLICFFSCGLPVTNDDVDLFRIKRVSGVWGSASSWGKTSVDRVRGLTCHKTDDYNMLYGACVDATVFGFEEVSPRVWCLYNVVYGNGVNVTADTWADPVVIERTDSGTAFAAAWPSLTYVDLHRALFTGYLQGEEYSRVLRMRGIYGDEFRETEWTDPMPFKAEGGPFGMVIDYRVGGDGYVYAACSNASYRAKASGESECDVSSRLMKYKVVDRWTGYKAGGVSIDYGALIAPDQYGELWLDNSDGGLNTLGSGDYAAFKRGSKVVLKRGYKTTGGYETSDWVHMWLEDYEYVVDLQGRSYLVIYTVGPWSLFSAMAAGRQYHWEDNDEAVSEIAGRLFALGGFQLLDGGEASAEISTLKPAVLINPGEDLRGAILKALSKVPDFVYWDQTTAYLKELADDEASDYSYGGSGNHKIISGRYGVRTPAYNHIEVFSGVDATAIPVFGDEVDWDEVDLVGHRLQKVFDYAYDTNAECDDRAVAQVRKHEATKKRGEIVTLPNVGLQLFDVITVTDDRCGVSSEIYRVKGIEETYDTTKKGLLYRQKVTLGAR